MKAKYINLIVEENPCELTSLVEEYLKQTRNYLWKLSDLDIKRECLSGLNRYERSEKISSLEDELYIKVGDIVYLDFGQAYLNESGYQHFGLVVLIKSYKAFVIPMSSNHQTIEKAPNYPHVIDPKEHLFYIGQPKGMSRESVLFLNDAKFVNTARIIEVKSHLDPNTRLFRRILRIYQSYFKM